MSKARDLANASTALGAVSATELAFVDGVTSAIQTQLDAKIGSASAINPTVVDAKGDLIAATAADTVARLAVGANGTVLTAASGEATGLSWATPSSGGMTLLSTTSLTGATTTISSISQAYNELYVLVYGITNATANGEVWCNINSVTSGVYYTTIRNSVVGQGTSTRISLGGGLDYLRTDANNVAFFTIQNYTSTANYKSFQGSAVFNANGTVLATIWGGGIATNSAITSLQFDAQGGDFTAGTVQIYGVK
jgi:hypothetical protein